ncbi:MAG: DUF6544 family protein [Anaerolineae bacterium]
MQILMLILGITAGLIALVWLGLQVSANRFPRLEVSPVTEFVPVPDSLPDPVRRFAHAVYGDQTPVVQMAIVQGRASLAPFGLPMPTRFRFYYDAARSSHYHDIQTTWFTLTFMRIHERNLSGHTMLDLGPIGHVEDQPKTNSAGIQGYWSEVLAWVPAIPLIDARVRWEAVDATTARLYLPGLDDAEAFTVTFDPDTGLIATLDTMRYQSEDKADRWAWHNRAHSWTALDGTPTMTQASTQWNTMTPWAQWRVEQVALNVDVSARLAVFGGNLPSPAGS